MPMASISSIPLLTFFVASCVVGILAETAAAVQRAMTWLGRRSSSATSILWIFAGAQLAPNRSAVHWEPWQGI